MKRVLISILAFLLLLGLLLPLTACEDGGKSKNDDNEAEETSSDNSGENGKESEPDDSGDVTEGALVFDGNTTFKPGKPEKELDPIDIYENLTYTPQMFYGDYRIMGGEDGEEEYAEEMSYVEYQSFNYKNEKVFETITAIPYRIEAGPHSFAHVVTKIGNREFLRAYFYTDSGYMDTVMCAYAVNGNTLYLTPLAFYSYDAETSHVRYILSETVLAYEFKFEGRKLTLEDGKNSLTLHSGLEFSTDNDFITVGNYCSAHSPVLNDIDYIRILLQKGDGENLDDTRYIYTEEKAYGKEQRPYAVMEENGIFTITMDEDGETFTRQFVYFYCYKDGIILTDGNTTYFYNESYSDRYGNKLDGNLTYEDMDKLENMDDEKLEEIIETKEDLLSDLADAFKDVDISATINPETGEITMDAAVLFPVGEYTVSNEGKALLQKFINVYTDVIFDEKYEGFISKIMVEGHTDSTGDYDSNQTLSQNRADSVKELCLEYGSDCEEQLSEMLQAVGFSSDKLIYDVFGKEDRTASRRVCFRFIINLG